MLLKKRKNTWNGNSTKAIWIIKRKLEDGFKRITVPFLHLQIPLMF